MLMPSELLTLLMMEMIWLSVDCTWGISCCRPLIRPWIVMLPMSCMTDEGDEMPSA